MRRLPAGAWGDTKTRVLIATATLDPPINLRKIANAVGVRTTDVVLVHLRDLQRVGLVKMERVKASTIQPNFAIVRVKGLNDGS